VGRYRLKAVPLSPVRGSDDDLGMAAATGPSRKRRATDDELLSWTREIALRAAPEKPSAITQKRFNESRSEIQSLCPEAGYIARSLGSSWAEALRVALQYEGNAFHLLGRRRGVLNADRTTCVEALRLIAERLQEPTLRPGEYEAEREAMINEKRLTRHREALQRRLPKESMLDHWGWDELLVEAGLQPRSRPKNRKGMPIPDAIERFLEVQGRLPSMRELERFANDEGFSVSRHKKLQPHMEALRDRRTQEGLWTPESVPKPSQRPPWQGLSNDPRMRQAVQEYPAARRDYWTLELIQHGLRVALSELGPGQRLTLPVLRRLAKENREIPTPAVVGRVAKKNGTTITELRAMAQQHHPL
jgi:hypothetical protein